jgi:FkbM family methyltransferase
MPSSHPEKRVIYDVGANNGDDVEYYLKKAELVVAVEANKELCEEIETRYASEISSGQLLVENCAVTIDSSVDSIDFYQFPHGSVVSSLVPPKEGGYEVVSVPAKTIGALIEQHGEPYYVKIDIEGYDALVLEDLFKSGYRPPYISAESHTADIYAIMLALGGYQSFQLVEGEQVEQLYGNHSIKTKVGKQKFSFARHSAGPFGEDIKGAWYQREDFHILLAQRGFGWRDIHATTEIEPKHRMLQTLPEDATLRMKLGKLKRRLLAR